MRSTCTAPVSEQQAALVGEVGPGEPVGPGAETGEPQAAGAGQDLQSMSQVLLLCHSSK